MKQQTRVSRSAAARADDLVPDMLLTQLQTLAELENRADRLRQELAVLQRRFVPCALQPCDRTGLFGHETVLVAGDQAVARAIGEEILASFGYQVMSAAADPDAWPAHRAIDLVLLDVPTMSDEQLARVRRAKERAAHVIVVTSLPEGPARAHLRQAGVEAFVAKPLEPLELARRVRQVLEGWSEPEA